MKKKSTGLALGGGGVLGAAHIGVLQALEEEEITITHIAGTSIGALIATLYAFGKSVDEIKEIALDLKWMQVTDISISKFALLSNKKLGKVLEEHIGDKNIEDADIPLGIVAANISTGEKVVLDKGLVATAVKASSSIPGIFEPVTMDDLMLVDGGIVENVPIQTVQDLGADYIVGVDLHANYSNGKPENILDVLMNSFHIILMASVKQRTDVVDLMIKPDLSDFNYTDTGQVKDLIRQGYKDAKKALRG
jgi:NTE family protein